MEHDFDRAAPEDRRRFRTLQEGEVAGRGGVLRGGDQRGGVDEIKLSSLIAARAAARKAKNFAESDRIRDELLGMGVVLKDSKDGTTWELAR